MRRLLLVLLLVLAACGGDDDDDVDASSDGTSTTTTAEAEVEETTSTTGGSTTTAASAGDDYERPITTRPAGATTTAAPTTAAPSPTTTGTVDGPPSEVTVTVAEFAFDPKSPTAAAGDIHFSVTNKDGAAHTFTIEGTDVDIALAPNGSGQDDATLDAGTYDFFCRIHSSMTGTLTVS